MPSLGEILRAHKVAIFSERHNEARGLINAYKTIFSEAAKDGIKDAMIEVAPDEQAEINRAYKAYVDYINNGNNAEQNRKEILTLLDDNLAMDNRRAKILLAAAHGLTLHAVDVGDRQDLDVYLAAKDKHAAYSKRNPKATYKEFLASLTKEDMNEFSDAAQRPMTTEDISDVVRKINSKGLKESYQERVKRGDPKIAKLMLSIANGKKFIAIFGNAHGGLVDEEKTGYSQEVDLDGALRIALGATEVVRIAISDYNSKDAKPNYRLKNDTLIPVQPKVQSIPIEIQEAARKRFDLPSR